MHKQFYFLSPVEVVKVTSQNLEEVAEWCGGSVQETESRRVPGRMDKYVLVPTPKDTNISWAFPGMFITKRLVVTVKDELRETFAVFRRDYFERNYFEAPKDAVDKTWERQASEKAPKTPPTFNVTVNVGTALLEAQQELNKVKEMAIEAGVDPEELKDLEVLTQEHNHPSYKVCHEHGCTADRYLDGIHVFTDKTVVAEPADQPKTVGEIPVEDLHSKA